MLGRLVQGTAKLRRRTMVVWKLWAHREWQRFIWMRFRSPVKLTFQLAHKQALGSVTPDELS